jgi:hypothetical protein
MIYDETKERPRSPLVIVQDRSGPDRAQAEVLIARGGVEDGHMDQLIGFAVHLFHSYKTNPNFYE